jgi:hydrogenase nickel incorporation protein HypA/HybF
MHEFSVAESLIGVVVDAARAGGMETVTSVRVQIGQLTCVEPEALQTAFSALAAEEPLMPGCRLEIVPIETEGRCRECHQTFSFPADLVCYCPHCGSGKTEIIRGRELLVETIEGESDHGSESSTECPESQ